VVVRFSDISGTACGLHDAFAQRITENDYRTLRGRVTDHR